MELSDEQWELVNFIEQVLRLPVINRSEETFVHEIFSLVKILKRFDANAYEIELALCLNFRINSSFEMLGVAEKLVAFGYPLKAADTIVKNLYDISDSMERNLPIDTIEEEADRLKYVSPEAQTVKLAELISVLETKDFSNVPMFERFMEYFSLRAKAMDKGNKNLQAYCEMLVEQQLLKLE